MQDATPFKFLFVTAVEARDLKNVQMIGKQDPYLKLWVGRAGTKVQTSVVDGGGSGATWGESFKFSVERLHAEEYLYFKVKNKNMTTAQTIGSGKVAIKSFGSSTTGQWYKLYDPNGRDAGEVRMEAKVSRRDNKNHATGGLDQNLLNASASGGATRGSPTAPVATGAWGAHSSSHQQQHSPMNQRAGLSPMSTQPYSAVPTDYGFANPAAHRDAAARATAALHHHQHQHQHQHGGYAVSPSSYAADVGDGSARSTENFSPASSNAGTVLPGMRSGWTNGLTSASAALSNFRGGHRPTASVPTAPAQFLDQQPTQRGWHPRRSSNAGVTTPSIPIRWANRPTATSVDFSNYPGPTAPSSLPTPPARSNFLGQGPKPFSTSGGPHRLPHGWEEKIASSGRTFYVDHTTKTTSWVRPGEASSGMTR